MSTLGDLVIDGGIQTGPFGSQLHASDYTEHGVGVVMPQDLGDNVVVPDAMARIEPTMAQSLARHQLRPGDIVFSRRGDVTRRALIRVDDGELICGTGCLRVRLDRERADPDYVSYALAVKEIQEWLIRHAVGATMANLNTGILSRVPIDTPELTAQRAVGAILSALDDKMVANSSIMKRTDELIRLLYGRLPLSELRLGDVAVNVRDSVGATEIAAAEMYVGLEHLGRRRLWITSRGVGEDVTSNKFRFLAGDVLFGKLRPYFHKVSLAPEQGLCSTDILVIRAKEPQCVPLVAAVASSDAVVAEAVQTSNGTRMPRAKWADIALCSVPDPDTASVREFCAAVDPLTKRAAQAVDENLRLAATRDELLPLLMSGKITVRDAEKTVEEVV